MSALAAAQEQLAYCQRECDKARHLEDQERLARCERFVRQCEVLISALEEKGVSA